jgi:hypothetical protein
LSHLYIKINILPRQARDEHRESTQKKVPFSLSAKVRDLFAQKDLGAMTSLSAVVPPHGMALFRLSK